MFSKHSSMSQDKDIKVEARRKKEKKVKALFKEILGWISGLPPHLSGLGTGLELFWLAPPMAA